MMLKTTIVLTVVLALFEPALADVASIPAYTGLIKEAKVLLPDLHSAQDTDRRVYYLPALNPEFHPNYPPYPITWADLMHRIAFADVVLLGEQHDDPATHRVELDTLQSIYWQAYQDRGIQLAFEMFERDVQPFIDEYLFDPYPPNLEAEQKFLVNSRPWSNYSQDYRPIIEFMRQSAEVFASNAPTAISRRVAKEGLEAVLPTLSAEECGWIAGTTSAPRDEYWRRFLEAMGGGASADAHSAGMSEEQIYRFYQAQCLKDDTMAETIARLRAEDPQRQVVHLSGSFHIDYHLGIYPRLKQRRADDKIVTVAIRPVENFEEATLQAALDAEPGVADYVVFVIREEPKGEAAPGEPASAS